MIESGISSKPTIINTFTAGGPGWTKPVWTRDCSVQHMTWQSEIGSKCERLHVVVVANDFVKWFLALLGLIVCANCGRGGLRILVLGRDMFETSGQS